MQKLEQKILKFVRFVWCWVVVWVIVRGGCSAQTMVHVKPNCSWAEFEVKVVVWALLLPKKLSSLWDAYPERFSTLYSPFLNSYWLSTFKQCNYWTPPSHLPPWEEEGPCWNNLQGDKHRSAQLSRRTQPGTTDHSWLQ